MKNMNLIHNLTTFIKFVLLAVLATLAISVAVPLTSSAQGEAKKHVCLAIDGCDESKGTDRVEGVIKTIINILSAVGGIIAVIMIVVGGLKFVTAGGDSNSVSSAKNTIVYAIVGLIIIAFAQVIVRFVLQSI